MQHSSTGNELHRLCLETFEGLVALNRPSGSVQFDSVYSALRFERFFAVDSVQLVIDASPGTKTEDALNPENIVDGYVEEGNL